MSKRLNVVNYIISMVLTLAAFFLVVYTLNNDYREGAFKMILALILGLVLSGFICTLLHELGHVIFGKKNGFELMSITVWFFNWTKVKGKMVFSFVFLGEEAGNTQMVAKSTENLRKRFYKMTIGGLLFTFLGMLVGIIPLFAGKMPLLVYCFVASFLPVGCYMFFGNALPMENGGALNDGGTAIGLKRNDDNCKVVVNLLAVYSEMYNGKTPCEIDKSLYFDLPQLPEDNYNFALLLNARYYYYLDCEEYEEAKKITKRLLSLEEYFTKSYGYSVKTDALYNACTFDYNEDTADDLMYELEKYLNGNNDATAVRVKLAYISRIKKEKDMIDVFYKKGIKEAKKCQLSGLGKFETKLIEKLKD